MRELAVAVADEETHRPLPVGERYHKVARLLGHPTLVRIRRHATEVDAAVTQLDEKEHVQAPQPDGVDRQKVTSDDRGRLRAQELGTTAIGERAADGNARQILVDVNRAAVILARARLTPNAHSAGQTNSLASPAPATRAKPSRSGGRATRVLRQGPVERNRLCARARRYPASFPPRRPARACAPVRYSSFRPFASKLSPKFASK